MVKIDIKEGKVVGSFSLYSEMNVPMDTVQMVKEF
jgi:hypothetical protein